MHLAHTDYQPTAGCVALPLEDLRRLLPRLAARVWLTIH
jgi:L,D-peptidoglycan transpeptidase YkuD (ErfK/YbiS/YcfS/YnhG family)